MKIEEYSKVKNMSYKEYAQYLQKKYGAASKAYFHYTKNGDHLTAGNVSRGAEGLQCHHICEDKVASLSCVEIATANDLSYQDPINLCYANLLEHLLLHIMITEEAEVLDEADDEILGNGGCQWMFLALNSIYSDPSNSWYSKKIANPEERGMRYNVNNIITDNKDTYLALVNRYCTSAIIRQKLSKTNIELAQSICNVCKADMGNLEIYEDIIKAAKDTFLFDWNVNCFADLVGYLKNNQTALIQICTGGGKTTTALEYIRLTGKKALVLGPKNVIEDSWKNANADYENYATFMNCYSTKDYSQYGCVVCDEAHHLEAQRWGEGVRYLINNSNIKIIGLTATPSQAQLDGNDSIFGDRLCNGLDLDEGILNGQIHPFSYVQSLYGIGELRDEFSKYGDIGNQLWGKLNVELNKNPIEKILRDNMREGVRKIIVFAPCVEDEEKAIDAMKLYDSKFADKEYLRVIDSRRDKEHNDEAKEWFNNTTEHDVCLVTVGMVNEGAHYNGINTLIMFRRTNSPTLYLQQLGRIVVTMKKEDPKGIVFDFTNNASNLIAKGARICGTHFEEDVTKEEKESSINKIMEAIKESITNNEGRELIYKDYTEDCAAILSALKDSQSVDKMTKKVFLAATSNGFEIEDFDFESWTGLKSKLSTSAKKGKKSGYKDLTEDTYLHRAENNHTNSTLIQSRSIEAEKAEMLRNAFRLVLRRSYMQGIIDFDNSQKMTMVVNDEMGLRNIALKVGFKGSYIIKKIAESLPKDTWIMAMDFAE